MIRTSRANLRRARDEARTVLNAAFNGWATPDVRLISEVVEPELRPWRVNATLFAILGVLAVIVATLGEYGALSFAVSQRTREMGVRLALGAQGGEVCRLLISENLRIVLVGIAAGLVLTLAGCRFIAPLLYATSPRDPVVLVSASAALVLPAILASIGPALRATRVNPVVALNAE